MGSAVDVKVGPGLLYLNVAESDLPAAFTDAWEDETVPWVPMGYTDEGHAFTATPSFEDIEVAEEYLPVRSEQVGLQLQLEFALAEITAANFKTAFNGGTITSGVGKVTFAPPPVTTAPIRVAIGWESSDHLERWVWYRCLQTGAVEVGRRKAPAKTTLPMAFRVELPLGGGAPFNADWKTA